MIFIRFYEILIIYEKSNAFKSLRGKMVILKNSKYINDFSKKSNISFKHDNQLWNREKNQNHSK
jgi:hypothetical protein